MGDDGTVNIQRADSPLSLLKQSFPQKAIFVLQGIYSVERVKEILSSKRNTFKRKVEYKTKHNYTLIHFLQTAQIFTGANEYRIRYNSD